MLSSLVGAMAMDALIAMMRSLDRGAESVRDIR